MLNFVTIKEKMDSEQVLMFFISVVNTIASYSFCLNQRITFPHRLLQNFQKLKRQWNVTSKQRIPPIAMKKNLIILQIVIVISVFVGL